MHQVDNKNMVGLPTTVLNICLCLFGCLLVSLFLCLFVCLLVSALACCFAFALLWLFVCFRCRSRVFGRWAEAAEAAEAAEVAEAQSRGEDAAAVRRRSGQGEKP